MAQLHRQHALAATVISTLLFTLKAQNSATFAYLVLTTYWIQRTTVLEGHFQEVSQDSFNMINIL